MSNRLVAAILAAGILIAGCGGSSSDSIGPTDPTSGNGDPGGSTSVGVFHPNFTPATGVLPYPIDLYFSGSTDGTLDGPVTPFLPNAETINALDGFSTVASSTVRFSAAIDPISISGTTVRMFEVLLDNANKSTTDVVRELAYDVDYTARVAATFDSGDATLEIAPLRPLLPSTGGINRGYLILLTDGLHDLDGNAATPSSDYATIRSGVGASPACSTVGNATLNGVCLLVASQFQQLGLDGILGLPPALSPANIVLTYTFSTQSTADVMTAATATVPVPPIGVQDAQLTVLELNPTQLPQSAAMADLYVGQLAISYYLDPADPIEGTWEAAPGGPDGTSTNLTRFNPLPVAKATNFPIPLFVTVPNAASTHTKPVTGWPVVVFQHGITGNRTQAAAIAGTYASQGFVVAAIDLVLHGITDPANRLFQDGAERTFDLDLDGSPGIDSSGTYFINLPSLLTTRDNLRQSSLDIIQLVKALPGLDLDGDASPDIDGARIHFAGLSLGAMVGTVANAMPIPTVSAYLNAPGGALPYLLQESQSFGHIIDEGLEANGLLPGMTLYDQFFRDAQTAVDAGDPINFIAEAVRTKPVLVSQVLNDQVVPNSATQRLINATPTPFAKASSDPFYPAAAGTGTWVHFMEGFHGSLVSSAASAAATIEMQTQAVTLAVSGGTDFAVTNTAILEP